MTYSGNQSRSHCPPVATRNRQVPTTHRLRCGARPACETTCLSISKCYELAQADCETECLRCAVADAWSRPRGNHTEERRDAKERTRSRNDMPVPGPQSIRTEANEAPRKPRQKAIRPHPTDAAPSRCSSRAQGFAPTHQRRCGKAHMDGQGGVVRHDRQKRPDVLGGVDERKLRLSRATTTLGGIGKAAGDMAWAPPPAALAWWRNTERAVSTPLECWGRVAQLAIRVSVVSRLRTRRA